MNAYERLLKRNKRLIQEELIPAVEQIYSGKERWMVGEEIIKHLNYLWKYDDGWFWYNDKRIIRLETVRDYLHSPSKQKTTSKSELSNHYFAFYSDEELLHLAEKTTNRFNKAYNDLKKISDEYGIDFKVSEIDILNIVFTKLKGRRDNSKKSVESALQSTISNLLYRGEYPLVQQITTLYNDGKYKEVFSLLQTI